MSSELGEIDQIAYAVHSIAEAVPRYEALFGAFRTARMHLSDLVYRGKTVDATIDVAFGTSGGLEIELVAPVAGMFPQQEFLRKYGEGLHHVRYTVGDLAEARLKLEQCGFRPVMTGRSERVAFGYFESPAMMGDSLVELVQRFD